MKKFAVLIALVWLLVASGQAAAFSGDWYLKGELERPSSPAFFSAFSPYDVDQVDVEFNNRTKSLAVALAFFETPPSGDITVALGIADQTSCAWVATLAVSTRPHTFTRQVFEPVYSTSPGYLEYRYTVAADALALPWTMVGMDGLNYKWSRWFPESRHYEGVRAVEREYVDANQHERLGQLRRAGVDGSLEQAYVAANETTSMAWTFSHPRLDGLVATCVEIVTPDRVQRLISALPIDEINEEPEDEEVVVSARRKRGKVQLAANQGSKIAVRFGRKQAQKNSRSITVTTNRRRVQVRVFTDAWSPWTTVTIKGQ